MLPSAPACGKKFLIPCSRRMTRLFQSKSKLSIRLPASEVGMIIDKGVDFPQEIDAALRTYGESMWFFREQPDAATTRALNTYAGDHREYVHVPGA
jgi:hypothetical protein